MWVYNRGKFQFIELMYLSCFGKKVTKEIARGEALRANSILAPDPTPAAFDHRPLKMSRFSAGSAVLSLQIC